MSAKIKGPPSIEDLAAVYAGKVAAPTEDPGPAADELWVPSLSPTQLEIFNDTSAYCLVEGPRYTGKGWVSGYKMIRHCWDNYNALVLVIVRRRSMALSGGIWYKLETEILPDYKKNLEGFEFKGPVTTLEKHLLFWVKNRFGGWSAIQLMSMPNGGNLQELTKGMEPSMVYVDELTEFSNDAYFTKLITMIGRRNHIASENQTYLATCNPHGPSHWVYARWHQLPFEGPAPDKDYKFFFLPISENPDPKAQLYLKRIIDGAKNNPVDYQRDVEGKWIDRPSGDAIFGGYFIPEFHVRGNLLENTILRPSTSRPITIGYDLGDVNSCMAFLQDRFTKEKTLWVGIDELVFTDNQVSFEKLVPLILDKMNYWCELEQHSFNFEHISDRSAFDRYRAASGSYDHQQIEKLSRSFLLKAPDRWPWLKVPIRMKECPKPAGSVAARIKVVRELLQNEQLFLSAPKCVKLIESIKHLESKKDDPLAPVRSAHLHIYDALSYALYYDALGGPIVPQAQKEAIVPQVTSVGS